MKRINILTGKLFKFKDARDDGFIFLKYKTSKIKKNGYFEECWLRPESFIKELQRLIKHQEDNSKRHNEVCKKYRQKNLDKMANLSAKYRADKYKQTPKWLSKSQLDEIFKFYEMAKTLESIFPWKQHVDHIIPLRGKDVCGLHVPWNLQIISEHMNKRKSNKVVL